jgi:protein TonB
MVILTVLWSRPPSSEKAAIPAEPAEPPRVSQRVFLPPPSVLRQYLPPPPPAARPRQVPTPPPAQPKAKDRISIGPPSEERSKRPLVLRREDDLTAVTKGRPDAGATPQAPASPVVAATPAPASASPAARAAPGLQLPQDLAGTTPAGRDGAPQRAPASPSIASSLRNLDKRLQAEGSGDGRRGIPTGTTVQQIGGFAFDPEGADFTHWINHLKTEVYNNWIMPTPALFGMRGHVDLEFTVERDGTVRDVRMLKSSGTPALDRAAQNALVGSRPLPLPSDYAPQSLLLQVTFYYNEGPQGT